MDASYIIYSLAVGLFTYHVFWMAARIYQFKTYPKTYGKHPKLSLGEIAESAVAQSIDIPAFRIIVPAYQEADVIEATLRRMASMNYPRTHFQVNVVTYEDEPRVDGKESTTHVVQRTSASINDSNGVELIRPLLTPAGYDGFFPGNLSAEVQHVGKGRGLNYALRCMHVDNERDERRYFIGKMSRSGYTTKINQIFSTLSCGFCSQAEASDFIIKNFDPDSPKYIGAFCSTIQLERLTVLVRRLDKQRRINRDTWKILKIFLKKESCRHFLCLQVSCQDGMEIPNIFFQVDEEKRFLYEIMRSVEMESLTDLEQYSLAREKGLEDKRPFLFESLGRANSSERIFQLTRKLNTRWVLVYDADADAPLDILRHLAGRLLAEPDSLGFQGPIAPLLNYDSVHPLCRMGALWLAFSHSTRYPRLLHNKSWAHPLAGTNWCFRIDGFLENGCLTRASEYDEEKRRFLLTFDPRHLTEDLETGIRNFSEYSVNASWHPIVEFEQAPPTPGALFRQYTRWSLGTLQTMAYIMRSRLPLSQKIWYFAYPLRILYATCGPFIAFGLIVAFYMELLKVNTVLAWWGLFLAAGNLIFIWGFIKTFERYYDILQRSVAVEFLYANSLVLSGLLRINGAELPLAYSGRLKTSLRQLRAGMSPGGWICRYIESRSIDLDDFSSSCQRVDTYLGSLTKHLPETLYEGAIQKLMKSMETAISRSPSARMGTPEYKLVSDGNFRNTDDKLLPLDKMITLIGSAASKAGRGRIVRWSEYHNQILLWSIPFVYFSVLPFFNAFRCWITQESTPWDKTVRTAKHDTSYTESEANREEV